MWKQDKLIRQLEYVGMIKEDVIISGGLAWHLMSPQHEETKHIHDHKDVDLFVIPRKAQSVFAELKKQGFHRYWTKYDGTSKDFIRYGKSSLRIDDEDKPIEEQRSVKMIFDLFIKEVPFIVVNSFKIVEPKHLLSFYDEKIHSSSACSAVKAARILVARGVNPIGRSELLG